MSLNLEGFLADVKRASLEAVEASKPFALTFGTVVSASPLKISVDQKLTLYKEQLILTNAVRDYSVEMTIDHTTGEALKSINLSHKHSYSGEAGPYSYSGSTQAAGSVSLTHTHAYSGKKKYTIHLGLKTGEKVILLRVNGGKQYIVLDRVEVPKA